MPKISAPTLAEHRARQRATLIAAAKQIVLAEGHQDVTFAAVAARAGLARNSVYEYFDSPRDLLGALVLEHMRAWTERVAEATAFADTPEDKIVTYMRAGLEHLATEQSLGRSLVEVPLLERYRAPLVDLIARMTSLLSDAIAQRGGPNPQATAAYLQGAMRAAARRIESGAATFDDEVRDVQEFALASTAPRPPAH